MAKCARCGKPTDPVFGCLHPGCGRKQPHETSIPVSSWRYIRPPCMEDLSKIATRNPVVNAFLNAWAAGSYASLESCLIGLAVHLAGQNDELMKHVYKAMTFGPSPLAEMMKVKASIPPAAEERWPSAAFVKGVIDGWTTEEIQTKKVDLPHLDQRPLTTVGDIASAWGTKVAERQAAKVVAEVEALCVDPSPVIVRESSP